METRSKNVRLITEYIKNAEDALNEHHTELIKSYLRFAKHKRAKYLQMLGKMLEDTKLSRLTEGTFTADEVKDMFDELHDVIKGDLEIELKDTAEAAAFLVMQMCYQSQHWHLDLNADIPGLENRDMLKKIRDLEENFSGSSNLDSPMKVKLQPLAESNGKVKLLQMEIDKLKDLNRKLLEDYDKVKNNLAEAIESKNSLSDRLEEVENELKAVKSQKVLNVEEDIKHLEDELFQVKKECYTAVTESAVNQQTLEGELLNTKQRLLEVQSQLQLAEKELELKFSETGAFKNMKQILSSKNEQIKTLRLQLSKYQSDEEN